MSRIVSNPDAFLSAWRHRLQRHAFGEGFFFGMAASAGMAFGISLAGVVFFPSHTVLAHGFPALWIFTVILGGGLIGGLLRMRPSKFSQLQVARIADRIVSGSNGRLTAWVELNEKLTPPWKAAMEREILDFLSVVKVPSPAWPGRSLRRATYIALAGCAGSLALLLWNDARLQERHRGIDAALQILGEAEQLLLAETGNPDSTIPPALNQELRLFLEREGRRLDASLTAAEANALARGIVAELEKRIREAGNESSPSELAARAVERDPETAFANLPFDAPREPEPTNPAAGKSPGGELVEMLAALKNSGTSPDMEMAPQSPVRQPLAPTENPADEAGAPENADLVSAESLPEGISSDSATGPAIPLQSDVLPGDGEIVEEEANVSELELPSESFTRPTGEVESAEQSDALPDNEKPNLSLEATNWDAVLEDALSQDVPAGSRETVRRYFENLRTGQP